jgi:glutamate racemase
VETVASVVDHTGGQRGNPFPPLIPSVSVLAMSDARPIGVFDSGLGGLTVLRALKRTLPHESTIYLGDTARVPYGTRSAETVIKYARNNARTLAGCADLKALVIACNTVSAVALGPLQEAFDIPVIGVIAPGARAALRAAPGGSLLILGTAGTVRSGAYERALAEAGYDGRTEARACPLFVPLVEEGWTEGEVPEQVARRYLAGVPDDLHAVVLGCTHYPHLRETLERVLPGPPPLSMAARPPPKSSKAFLRRAACSSPRARRPAIACW